MIRRGFTVAAIAALGLSCLTAPVNAATTTEINQAIQDGLAWLATQQNPDGSFGSGYPLAQTATAVLAFENEGHFPGGGTAYSSNVEKGLDYLFRYSYKTGISVQAVGYPGRNDNPDTNGNGQGVYFKRSSYMYETGLVMQAIVASNAPNRVVGGTAFLGAAAAGGGHSLALKADGSIVGWGLNGNGQAIPPAGNDLGVTRRARPHKVL
ncbi:MAG: hypothetical protein KA354_24060 [Phycisphaerae bacterium]|nr:hypothetical protein [Phycisphaerae bacterium]